MQKKVELHCHFDGSLDLKTSYQLALKRGIIDEKMSYEQFVKKMMVSKDNKDLNTFLDRFVFPIAILQDEEAIVESMKALIQNLKDEGIVYAEIRFAPQFFTHKGLTQDEVVSFALKAREWAHTYIKGIKVNFILCMMVLGDSINEGFNTVTIDVAKKYYGKGVCAIDLAGYEGGHPMIDFKPLFDYAKSLGLPYTIHAGESGPASFVEDAIKLGSSRIGHGGHATQDESVIALLLKHQIPLEMCVTSNLQCNNQPSYSQHAIHELYKHKVCITLSTDNRTLSGITLEDEYQSLLETKKLTKEDIDGFILNAINAAFISDKEKEELKIACGFN